MCSGRPDQLRTGRLGATLFLRCMLAVPFVFVGGPLLIADDSSVDAVDRKSELAASLLAGVMANNSAIRSCDFVFTTEYIVMHPAQGLTCQDEKCRLVYNADLQKRVLIRWVVTDNIPEEESQRTTSNLMALFFDDTREVRQVSAAGKKSLQFHEGSNVRAMIKVPRLLSIGLVAFPDTHEHVDDQNPIWESLAIPSRDTVASILSPGIARVVSKSFDDGVVRNETVWTFDLKTLMPTKRSGRLHGDLPAK